MTERQHAAHLADEQQLIADARRGDQPAIAELIRRNNQLLFRLARGLLRSDDEAEDTVQETYLLAFSRLDSFRGDASFSTWLCRIAINQALANGRKKSPVVDLAVLDDASDDASIGNGDSARFLVFPTTTSTPSPEAEAARRQLRRLLERAIADLPDHFRVVFMLRDIEGLSIEETAAHLTLRPQTVKTRLHRARRLLKTMLEAELAISLGELFPFAGARCGRMADRVLKQLGTTIS